MERKTKHDIPGEVKEIGALLGEKGYEAYLVGGCVRDLLLGREPKDWDVATNATPDKVQELFLNFHGGTPENPSTVYENDFGTVLVKLAPRKDADSTQNNAESFQRDSALSPRVSATTRVVEVTTFREEGKYTDKRHPDYITFAKTIDEDLSRRDFTINAIRNGSCQVDSWGNH